MLARGRRGLIFVRLQHFVLSLLYSMHIRIGPIAICQACLGPASRGLLVGSPVTAVLLPACRTFGVRRLAAAFEAASPPTNHISFAPRARAMLIPVHPEPRRDCAPSVR